MGGCVITTFPLSPLWCTLALLYRKAQGDKGVRERGSKETKEGPTMGQDPEWTNYTIHDMTRDVFHLSSIALSCRRDTSVDFRAVGQHVGGRMRGHPTTGNRPRAV